MRRPAPARSNEVGDYIRAPSDGLDDDLRDEQPAIELVAGAEADGGRLDKWLAGRLSAYSRSRLRRWIEDGRVARDGVRLAVRDPVFEGDAVTVEPCASDDESAFRPEPVPLPIVFEDDALIVIDKPAGLVVHPAAGNWSGTLLNGLLHHLPALAAVPRAGIVHRLDKDTTGLMVVGKTIVAQTDLVRQLQARSVGRTYLAVVDGTPPASGVVDLAIGRDPGDRTRMTSAPGPRDGFKPAVTRFETLASIATDRGRTVSAVRCRLETGRTHQIRVHMKAIGHPLLGDATYGGAAPHAGLGRQALHAWRLQLVHPSTGGLCDWAAPLPHDLATFAAALGFDVERLTRASDA